MIKQYINNGKEGLIDVTTVGGCTSKEKARAIANGFVFKCSACDCIQSSIGESHYSDCIELDKYFDKADKGAVIETKFTENELAVFTLKDGLKYEELSESADTSAYEKNGVYPVPCEQLPDYWRYAVDVILVGIVAAALCVAFTLVFQ